MICCKVDFDIADVSLTKAKASYVSRSKSGFTTSDATSKKEAICPMVSF
jgi:hypothetical protein